MKIALWVLILLSNHLNASICEQASSCFTPFNVGEHFLTTYQSHQPGDRKITRAIIVVHGALRNGDTYFNNMVIAAKQNKVTSHTLIVAPHFRQSTDERKNSEMYWGRRWYHKWRYGYMSEDKEAVSSFEVMDRLILDLQAKFPNLKEFIITGHSAGGQFTQRYAVGTKIHKQVDITFVPSNPSSYMYLHPERYDFSLGNFELRGDDPNCPEFNHYIYGVKDRARYLERLSIEELRSNFADKKVFYLMSEEDRGTDSLDRSCEAMLQGKNRIERAQNFFYYINKKFPRHQHRFFSIPKIAHEHLDVFTSNEASQVIFKTIPFRDKSFYSYRKMGELKNQIVINPKSFFMFGGGKNEAGGFKEFLSLIKGGNLLVISGKDTLYHRYTFDFNRLSEELKIGLQSIETISFHHRKAGNDSFVLSRIKEADGIFFTGGNQAKYLNRIKGTAAHQAILAKNVPIAGTSAGLAIMGEYIFSARQGGVSSDYALRNPQDSVIDIENDFFQTPILEKLITDTHFSERQREGRLLSFMSRAQQDHKPELIFGLGIDEQTSLQMTDESMFVRGKGDAFLYRHKGIPQRSTSGLNYGPIERIRLEKNKAHTHYSEINFTQAEVLNVEAGRIK